MTDALKCVTGTIPDRSDKLGVEASHVLLKSGTLRVDDEGFLLAFKGEVFTG
jgi:hypothetical protein